MEINITKRRRRRVQRSGEIKWQVRWVLNFKERGKRRQRFYESKEEATAARDRLLEAHVTGAPLPTRTNLTVEGAIDYWLEAKRGEVEPETIEDYRKYSAHLTRLIGHVLISDLTTGDIRKWYNLVAEQVTRYTAQRAKQYLKTALSLAAEELGVRPPPIPSIRIGARPKPATFTLEQVSQLIRHCQTEPFGIFVLFLLMTGVRPGELLALTWDCFDLDAGVVHIRRSLTRRGALRDTTKTPSGVRTLPLPSMLRAALVEWKARCPSTELAFPAPRGSPLIYVSFHDRIWKPILKRAGLPPIRSYACRHAYISGLQAAGVEIALAAKLAGHASPEITAAVYSHAVRGGEEAVAALERLYSKP